MIKDSAQMYDIMLNKINKYLSNFMDVEFHTPFKGVDGVVDILARPRYGYRYDILRLLYKCALCWFLAS